MIDLKNGRVKIADDLIIYPNYTFDSFKKTSFYTNQDGIRVIVPEKQQVIDKITLFFMTENKCCKLQAWGESESTHRVY